MVDNFNLQRRASFFQLAASKANRLMGREYGTRLSGGENSIVWPQLCADEGQEMESYYK